MSRYGVFSGPYFPVFGLNMEIYEVNTGKYGPGKTPYLDTFHALICKRYRNGPTQWQMRIQMVSVTPLFSETVINNSAVPEFISCLS